MFPFQKRCLFSSYKKKTTELFYRMNIKRPASLLCTAPSSYFPLWKKQSDLINTIETTVVGILSIHSSIKVKVRWSCAYLDGHTNFHLKCNYESVIPRWINRFTDVPISTGRRTNFKLVLCCWDIMKKYPLSIPSYPF